MAAPLPFSESELRRLQVLLKRKVRVLADGHRRADFLEESIEVRRREDDHEFAGHFVASRPYSSSTAR